MRLPGGAPRWLLPITLSLVIAVAATLAARAMLGLGGEDAVDVRPEAPGLRWLFDIPATWPTGVAVGPDGGFVYVASGDGVEAFDREGRRVAAWQLPGGLPALHLAVFADGSVLVTDGNHTGLWQFTAGGALLGELRPAEGDWAPLGVAASPEGGAIVLDASPGRHRVMMLRRDGRVAREFGGQGSAPARFEYPNDAAFAGDTLYVSDSGNGRVQAFSAGGEYQMELRGGPGGARLTRPLGIAVYADRLAVVDRARGAVAVYSLRSYPPRPLYWLGSPGDGPGRFVSPSGLAFDETGRLYIADSGNNRVQVWG